MHPNSCRENFTQRFCRDDLYRAFLAFEWCYQPEASDDLGGKTSTVSEGTINSEEAVSRGDIIAERKNVI
jgi:hypothetical protein